MEQNKQLNPMEQLSKQFIERRADFLDALPNNCTFEKFVRVVKTAIIQNQELLKADRMSLFMSCYKAAQDGLFPDGRESALILFGDKVQYMPMIAGVLKKMRNSGEIKSVSSYVVYEQDEFTYELGDNEYIKHKPSMGERGKPICVYAIVHIKNGGIYREVMSISDVEKIRACSKASRSLPWQNFWDEMAKKTVIRRLSKRLPMNTEVQTVINRDDELFDSHSVPKKQSHSIVDMLNDEVTNDVTKKQTHSIVEILNDEVTNDVMVKNE